MKHRFVEMAESLMVCSGCHLLGIPVASPVPTLAMGLDGQPVVDCPGACEPTGCVLNPKVHEKVGKILVEAEAMA